MHEPKFEMSVCMLHVTNTTQHNEPKLNTNDFDFGGSYFLSNSAPALGYFPTKDPVSKSGKGFELAKCHRPKLNATKVANLRQDWFRPMKC